MRMPCDQSGTADDEDVSAGQETVQGEDGTDYDADPLNPVLGALVGIVVRAAVFVCKSMGC